jgi:hypothetical protein
MADKSGNWLARHKVLSVILGFFGLIIIVSTASGGSKTNNSQPKNSTSSNTANTQPAQTKAPELSVPAEYKSALVKAKQYSDTAHMSKQGIYDQLTSDYGEKFKPEAAQYAVDNLKTDYNANALAKAKEYQKTANMSPAAIHDQLTSTYGEKFTQAEADYAIQHLND